MKALIIPSAVLIPREMQKKFGKIPSVLYPLRDAPILEYLCEKYSAQADRIYIAAHKKRALIEDYVRLKKLPVRIVALETLGDLGSTVRAGLHAALMDCPELEYAYINFADTLLSDDVSCMQGDTAYYATAPYEEEWTYFSHENGRILHLIDKASSDETADSQPHRLFVGSFGVAAPQLFLSRLERAQGRADGTDSFYAALSEYSARRPISFLKTENWFDAGHSENYMKAKTGVEARSFNLIRVDEARGILTKTSENKEKLCNEIRWYIRIPNRLQYLLPRVYDYSLEPSRPYVSMEYYGYSTLHELLLYGDIPLMKWQMIFEKLLFAVRDMEKYTLEDRRELLEASLRAIYVEKTASRLSEMRSHRTFAPFFTQETVVNGVTFRPLDEILAALPDLVERLVVARFDGRFNIIHGDLCFSNILIEDNYGFIRVIDPRGQFGGYDIYGDPRYEIAKLLHTLEGNYDFIIEDLFSVEVNGTSIRYSAPSKTRPVLEVFLDVFEEKLAGGSAVRLIEATLFLSMIPLHSDSLDRQLAMLATGLTLLGQVLEAEKNQEGRGILYA